MKPDTLPRLRSIVCLAAGLMGSAFAQSTSPTPVYRWSTLAGRASVGLEDGPIADARFNNPHGLAMDPTGNLYVADTDNHTIRKISVAGLVSTFAGLAQESGSADGTGSSARFNRPQGIAADLNGNVYVADTGNHTIRKITPAGVVTTLAGRAGIKGTVDGAAASALFDSPATLSVDRKGNVYLSNNGIRKISNGQVQTLAIPAQVVDPDARTVTINTGTCPAIDAADQLYFTTSIAGEHLKVSPTGTTTIFRNSLYSTFTNQATTADKYTGDALFSNVNGNLFLEIVLRNGPGNVYLQSIRGMPMQSDGSVVLSQAMSFTNYIGRAIEPTGLAVDPTGKCYYTREGDDVIMRDAAPYAGTARPREGLDGVGQSARFEFAKYLTVDPVGNIWIAENAKRYYSTAWADNYIYAAQLRKLSTQGIVTTEFDAPIINYLARPDFDPAGITSDISGNVFLTIRSGYILSDTNNVNFGIIQIKPDGRVFNLGATPLGYVYGIAAGASEKLLLLALTTPSYIPDYFKVLQRQDDGTWTKLAGGNSEEIADGTGDNARFNHPYSIKADRLGNFFLLDLAGPGMRGMEYVPPGDTYIRKINSAGTVTTVSKKLTGSLSSLAVDSKGTFFLTHADLGIITQIDANGNEVTIGGTAGKIGSTDGNTGEARFANPGSITVDAQNNLYLVDGFGTTVRKGEYLGDTPGIVTQPQGQTVAAGGSVQFTVTANNPTSVTYQWYFNDTPFSGATTSTLSFANARSTDAGDYTVVVTNSVGSVTSNKATLTVSAASTSTPTPSPASGGGGGGSIEAWFVFSLLAIGAARIGRGQG